MSGRGFHTEGVAETRYAKSQEGSYIEACQRAKRKWQRMFKGAWCHTYILDAQLYRGDSKFPRTKTMTIGAMGNANRAFVKQHIARMDKGTEGELWVWRMADFPKTKEDRNKCYTWAYSRPHDENETEIADYIKDMNAVNYPPESK